MSESVRPIYDLGGDNGEGKRVVVQGWGNVGAAAALYLAQAGASVVGIIDRVGGVLRPDGLTYEEVKELFLAKQGNALRSKELVPFEEVNARIWDLDHEVFLPCVRAVWSRKTRSNAWSRRGWK